MSGFDESEKENIMPPNPNIQLTGTGTGTGTETGTVGGRRHKGSKKMHKGKRHGNASLRAWVTFVKKVQKEEGVSYKEAMMRAKKRKDHGEKWRGGDGMGTDKMDEVPYSSDIMQGGRRRTRKHRGSKKRRHSRCRRR